MSPAEKLLLNLSEAMADSAKAAKTPLEYEGHSEEAATLKRMASKVKDMDEDQALSFILSIEPVERREALLRLGMQTKAIVFADAD